MTITAATPKISAPERTALRELTSQAVGVIDLAPPDLMGSIDHSITLEPRDLTRLAASNLDDAIVEARSIVAGDPLGQARAIVDAGNGSRWLLRAVATREGENGAPVPLYLNERSAGRPVKDAVAGFEALVDDAHAVRVAAADAPPADLL